MTHGLPPINPHAAAHAAQAAETKSIAAPPADNPAPRSSVSRSHDALSPLDGSANPGATEPSARARGRAVAPSMTAAASPKAAPPTPSSKLSVVVRVQKGVMAAADAFKRPEPAIGAMVWSIPSDVRIAEVRNAVESLLRRIDGTWPS